MRACSSVPFPSTATTRTSRFTAPALAFTVVAAVAFAIAQPPVGDFWAARARQSAVSHGVGLRYWFAWFGGTVPGHYSVLGPYVVRFVNLGLLGAGSTIVVVALCRVLVRDTPGHVAATWVAAVGACFSLWSGRIPFALGTALMLIALVCVRADRRFPAAAVGAAAALVSPVSGAFLVLGLVGVALHDPRRRTTVLWTVGSAGVCLLAVGVYFGLPGSQGFQVPQALVAAAALSAMLAARPPAYVRTVLLISLVACPLLVIVPNGMGSNFERLTWICLPVAVAATGQARRAVVVLTSVAALTAGVAGSVKDLYVAAQPMSRSSYTAGLVAQLDRTPGLADYRVEVVPDGTHVAAYALLDHASLARGFETQSDNSLDGILSSPRLDAASFRRWLDQNAVGYVALDRRTLKSGPEDRLVRSRTLRYLHEIWSDAHWQLFAVAAPAPIVDRPARVATATQADLTVTAPAAGHFALRIHWSTFLRVRATPGGRAPSATLSPDGHGWTVLSTTGPGDYVLSG
jgi:hypothetical protein